MTQRLAGHVKSCELAGAVVVLDTRAGTYHALSPECTEPWKKLCAHAHVRPDFLDMLAERGWLSADDSPPVDGAGPRRQVPWRPGAVFAMLAILQARFILWRGGFRAGYDWAERHGRIPGRPRFSHDDLAPALAGFLRAEALMPSRLGDQDCLPRSFALFVHLRRLGLGVRHVIGVGQFPFDAHAWVEHDDTALLEFNAETARPGTTRRGRDRTPISVIG